MSKSNEIASIIFDSISNIDKISVESISVAISPLLKDMKYCLAVHSFKDIKSPSRVQKLAYHTFNIERERDAFFDKVSDLVGVEKAKEMAEIYNQGYFNKMELDLIHQDACLKIIEGVVDKDSVMEMSKLKGDLKTMLSTFKVAITDLKVLQKNVDKKRLALENVRAAHKTSTSSYKKKISSLEEEVSNLKGRMLLEDKDVLMKVIAKLKGDLAIAIYDRELLKAKLDALTVQNQRPRINRKGM
jgi:hypothetical protein